MASLWCVHGGYGIEIRVLVSSFCCQCFFLSSDFLAAFLDAFAHFLQGFAGAGSGCFDAFGSKLLVFRDVLLVSGDDLFMLCHDGFLC